MKLPQLIELIGLDLESCRVDLEGGSHSMPEMDVSPTTFLMQAEDDHRQGGVSSRLNSITNSKRAIVCQMDQALLAFGYKPLRWKIPKKIEVLNGLGVFAPSVLRKVSSARNFLEHEYVAPTNEQVEESLDLAALFVFSTKSLMSPFSDEVSLYSHDYSEIRNDAKSEITGKNIYFGIREVDGVIKFNACAYVDGQLLAETNFSNTDPIFMKLVKLGASLSLRYRVDEAISEFEEALRNSQ